MKADDLITKQRDRRISLINGHKNDRESNGKIVFSSEPLDDDQIFMFERADSLFFSKNYEEYMESIDIYISLLESVGQLVVNCISEKHLLVLSQYLMQDGDVSYLSLLFLSKLLYPEMDSYTKMKLSIISTGNLTQVFSKFLENGSVSCQKLCLVVMSSLMQISEGFSHQFSNVELFKLIFERYTYNPKLVINVLCSFFTFGSVSEESERTIFKFLFHQTSFSPETVTKHMLRAIQIVINDPRSDIKKIIVESSFVYQLSFLLSIASSEKQIIVLQILSECVVYGDAIMEQMKYYGIVDAIERIILNSSNDQFLYLCSEFIRNWIASCDEMANIEYMSRKLFENQAFESCIVRGCWKTKVNSIKALNSIISSGIQNFTISANIIREIIDMSDTNDNNFLMHILGIFIELWDQCESYEFLESLNKLYENLLKSSNDETHPNVSQFISLFELRSQDLYSEIPTTQ